MNNCPNNNSIYQEALNKIEHDQKFKPDCCSFIGVIGPTGPTGPIGLEGLPGPEGAQGATGPTGPMGPQGDVGPQGEVGPPVTITIGNIVTTDANMDADVTDSGSGTEHILNFSIPRGATGMQGPIGPTGPTGTSVTILGSYVSLELLKQEHPTGTIGQSYLVNGNLYVWSNTSQTWVDVGVIRGPQGLQGETGPTGPQGPRGIQGLQGIAGEIGPTGPRGASGEIGPTGPAGPQEIGVAYFVTFDGNNSQGYTVASNGRLPIGRKEVDNTNMCKLNSVANTITFNKGGVYKVDFIVNAYIESVSSFEPTTNFLSIGFKKTNESIVYAGDSVWYSSEGNVTLVGQGVFLIANPETEAVELVNMSTQPLILKTPYLAYTTSSSYFVNPVLTIIIQFLG